uniref:Uncharacterized protein n=1 Tax=Arundo donax TaxID=35708 RepID=A0A0A9HUZ7_ARUDO
MDRSSQLEVNVLIIWLYSVLGCLLSFARIHLRFLKVLPFLCDSVLLLALFHMYMQRACMTFNTLVQLWAYSMLGRSFLFASVHLRFMTSPIIFMTQFCS